MATRGGRGDGNPRGRGDGNSRGRGDSKSRGRGDGSSRGRGGGQGNFQNQHSRGGGQGGFQGHTAGPPRGNSGGRGAYAYRPRDPAPPAPEIYLENAPAPKPERRVTDAEDERVKLIRNKMIEGFPGRPDHGTKGKHIILRANYFEIKPIRPVKKQPETTLYRYAVSFKAELSKPVSRRVVEQIVKLPLFEGVHWASDYRGLFVTTTKLDLGPAGVLRDKIELVEGSEPPTPPSPSDTPEIKDARLRRTKEFTIVPSGSFQMSDLIGSVRSNDPGSFFEAKGDLIQLLNIILAKAPNMEAHIYSSPGNKFFPDGHDLTVSHDIGGGLRALRGCFASARTSTQRILLNLNVCTAAFYNSGPLRKLMDEHSNFSRSPTVLRELEIFLHFLRVETRYLKSRSSGNIIAKTKTIQGFARDPKSGNFTDARSTIFELDTGRKISVFDYFKEEHKKTLAFPKEPVLNVGTRSKPSYLPVELCFVLPGQASKRLLGPKQTSQMITFACRPPSENAMSIAGTVSEPGHVIRTLGLGVETQATTVNLFGFGVDTNMITVPGRILVAPQIRYGNSKTMSPVAGSWNAANTAFKKAGRFKKWSWLAMDPIDLPQIRESVRKLSTALAKCGISMGAYLNPSDNFALGQTPQDKDVALDRRFSAASAQGIEILLIILKDTDKWLYSRIKFYGDVKHGVQTICVVEHKFTKGPGQGGYFGNLAMKFSIKGGGNSHEIPAKDLDPLGDHTMLVGIDVTHPSPGSKEGAPSIAAVVASIDNSLSQWPGSIMAQTSRVEMVEGLTNMMVDRLQLWRKKQKSLPEKIIIYRDGVSEGQYRLILDIELPSIQTAFKQLYGDEKKWPKLTIIVVGKRHHTRFYPTKADDADQKYGFNPQPGTVVDRGVTDHFLWDFFLQAHAGIHGTARPAHYVVIMDQIGFKQDQLEQFTHRMCYLFNRATKAVSICPPAYYADLLCERGRMYLHSVFNEQAVSGGGAHTAANAQWTRGVHSNLEEKTFYI